MTMTTERALNPVDAQLAPPIAFTPDPGVYTVRSDIAGPVLDGMNHWLAFYNEVSPSLANGVTMPKRESDGSLLLVTHEAQIAMSGMMLLADDLERSRRRRNRDHAQTVRGLCGVVSAALMAPAAVLE